MAGCTLTKGRGYFCGGQVGGIKKVFLADYHDAESIITVTASASTGIVSDMVTKAGGDLTFFEFDLDRQLSSFTQGIVTGKGGAVAYSQDLELHMSHDSEESWAMMQNVVEGLWQIIVLDNNGVYYLLGKENGIEIGDGSFGHGGDVAYTDYVGYVVSMKGAEPIPAFNLSTATPFKAWTTDTLVLSATQYNTAQV
tara:strand:- start:441 stop:1028 length:588 start_codon:yes stop_codon:yes gene_type:complete